MTKAITGLLSEQAPAPLKFPFSRANIAFILVLYAISGLILYNYIGIWEAVRHALINGSIVAAWLMSATLILRDEAVPEYVPVRRPGLELTWVLVTLGVMITLATNHYLGAFPLPSWIYLAVSYGAILLLFVSGRYSRRAFGISLPSKRGWVALLVVILINVAAAAVFILVPQGEAAVPPQANLANQINGPVTALLLIAGLLFRAALPEELVLRISLQPRLACFMSLGTAIVIQALLFNAGHLPQLLFRDHKPLLLSVGYLIAIDNGLIGGYLWHRTRSLPLLAILHLFAYIRFGI